MSTIPVYAVMRQYACHSDLLKCLFTVLALLVLSSCEAPLNLEGVNEQRSRPVARFDHFQAVAGNSHSIVVVGSGGVVLTSTDTAETWSRQVLPDYPALIDVTACANGTYAILDFSRHVWVSDDDGESWRKKPLATEETPLAISCDPDNHLWVVGSFSTFLSSHDNGESWQIKSLDEDLMLTSIQFIDESVAYVCGEFGTVLKTTDKGENWEYMQPLPGEFYPQDCHFDDEQHGWAVGLRGRILHTSDGADSWQDQTTDVDIPVYGIGANGSGLYAVGDNGLLLEYANGEWEMRNHKLPIRFYLRAVKSLNDQSILIAGGAGAVHKVRLD